MNIFVTQVNCCYLDHLQKFNLFLQLTNSIDQCKNGKVKVNQDNIQLVINSIVNPQRYVLVG